MDTKNECGVCFKEVRLLDLCSPKGGVVLETEVFG